jgi:hypothetical protein
MNERGNTEGLPDPNAPDPSAPPPPAGLLASHDPKAVKPMLDLLKQYNQGLTTHAQAIGTLIAMYGLSPEDAANILPPNPALSSDTGA